MKGGRNRWQACWEEGQACKRKRAGPQGNKPGVGDTTNGMAKYMCAHAKKGSRRGRGKANGKEYKTMG